MGSKQAYGAGKFGAKSFAGPVLASLAKRFITAIGTQSTPKVVNVANPLRQILTTIPRNISGTNEQQENRVGRKIFIKGITLKTGVNAIVNMATNLNRLMVIRQMDPTEDLSAQFDVHAPVGATKGFKVLYDKHYWLSALTDNSDPSNKIFNHYIKVNKFLSFDGDVNDGTDTDVGTIVIYNIGTDPVGHNFIGSCTVHYREII